MLNWLRRSALPPLTQGPIGSKADREWAAAPEPGILETLFGWGSDGKRYELPPEDAKRLRPILLPDPRAERNRKIAEQRRAARASGERNPAPISFANDAPQRAPEAYSLDAFPMPDEAKRFYGGGFQRPEFGPRHSDGPTPWKSRSTGSLETESACPPRHRDRR